MPDIELKPGEYRAPPEKGQPVFKPGGRLILLYVIGMMVAGTILAAIFHPISVWIIDRIWPLIWPQ